MIVDYPTPNDGKNYSEDEDAFLRREYGKSPSIEIAKALGRKPEGIKSRARKLGINYDRAPEDVPEGMKYCRTCETTLPVEEFGHHAGSPDGRYSVCKTCASIKKKKKRLEDKEKKILGEAKKQEEEIQKLIEEKNRQSFVCGVCGEEKPGTHFRFDKVRMKIETRCHECKMENNLKNKVKRIKNGSDW